MKKIGYLFLLILMYSCTSNTIFEKPKDLIPKDTMSLLIQEMMIATSSKYVKNKNLEKNINYMPFVYDKFNIDSTRFHHSNLYYMSKIDDYKQIFTDAKTSLDNKIAYYKEIEKTKDSIRKDSLLKIKKIHKRDDSIKKIMSNKNREPKSPLRGLTPN